MLVFRYDQSFEGLLSAIFDAFKLKKYPEQLLGEADITPLFTQEVHLVITDKAKSDRVEKALKTRLTPYDLKQLTYVWLSEIPQSDELLFRYLHKVFSVNYHLATDYADEDVLACRNLAHKVGKEAEFLRQFVRFKAIKMMNEKVYVAVISSQCNVLPLVIPFFHDRYRDQKWAIYDHKRCYGYFYDLAKAERITLDDDSDFVIGNALNEQHFSSEEHVFQKMWSQYCKAITIKERINLKQQRSYMPKRFWQYLPEITTD